MPTRFKCLEATEYRMPLHGLTADRRLYMCLNLKGETYLRQELCMFGYPASKRYSDK